MEQMSKEVKIETSDRYQNTLLGLETPCNEEGAAANITSPGSTSSFRSINSKQRWNESPEARVRRLARNAERMRERRARETEDEYRRRLCRNAEANRTRRQNESEVERAMRLVRNAARQRLRRAMESPEQRAKRLAKLAERMRIYRANETPEQRKERLTEMAARARERISRESSEERRERLRKLSEYAKKVRSSKNNIKNVNSNMNLNQNSNLGTVNSSQLPQNPQVQGLAQHHQSEGHNHQQQQSEQAYPQNIINSIEYYQNMFIHTALRPNMTKEQINPQQPEPPLRFMHSNMPMEANTSPNLFQQGQYDSAKIPKFQNTQNQTLTDTIEFYQNKFIKAEKPPENQSDKNVIPLQQNFEHKNINCDKKGPDPNYSTHQHMQGSHTPLYNQFPYLNTFPPAHAPGNVNNQQNYYSMYHNGFQLAITPNSVPPPFTPVHFQNSGVQSPNHPYTLLNSSPQNQVVTDFPKAGRGRFKKEFADSELSRLPPDMPDESIRQPKDDFLENEINQVLASPKRCRGGPGRGQESEEERRIRLDKMAAHQRRVRANETSDERVARLKSLSERARLKRAQIRATESQDQRRQRLAKQAEYARLRRLKAQTPEHKRRMEEKAKELYAQLHNLPLPPQQQSNMNPQMSSHSDASSDDFVKNPAKDFAQSENNDVLKILEPIIVMKAK